MVLGNFFLAGEAVKRGQRELPGVRSAYLERLSKKKQARIQPSPSVGVPAVPGTEPRQFRKRPAEMLEDACDVCGMAADVLYPNGDRLCHEHAPRPPETLQ